MFIEVPGFQIYKTLIIVGIIEAGFSIHKLIAKCNKLSSLNYYDSKNHLFINLSQIYRGRREVFVTRNDPC